MEPGKYEAAKGAQVRKTGKKPRWSKDPEVCLSLILEDVRKCSGPTDFEKKYPRSFRKANNTKDSDGMWLMDRVRVDRGWKKREESEPWPEDPEECYSLILKDARKCDRPGEFRRKYNRSRVKAETTFDVNNIPLIDRVREDRGWKKRENRPWPENIEKCYDLIIEDALKCNGPGDFQIRYTRSFNKANHSFDANYILLMDRVREDRGWKKKEKREPWPENADDCLKLILDDARKCRFIGEFRKTYGRSFRKANSTKDSNGFWLIDHVREDRGWRRRERESWSKDPEERFLQVLEFARPFNSINEWKEKHQISYQAARSMSDASGLQLHKRVEKHLGLDRKKNVYDFSEDLIKQLITGAIKYNGINELKNKNKSLYKIAIRNFDLDGNPLLHRLSEILGWERERPSQNTLYLWSSHPDGRISNVQNGITKMGLTSELSAGTNDKRISQVHNSCVPSLTKPQVLLLTALEGRSPELDAGRIERSSLDYGIGDKDHGVTIRGDNSNGQTEMRATSPVETLKLLAHMREEIFDTYRDTSMSQDELLDMEARALADVSDKVDISPIARLSIFQDDGAGQDIVRHMIEKMESNRYLIFSSRGRFMPDEEHMARLIQRAAEDLHVDIPWMDADRVPREAYKAFIDNKRESMYFGDLQGFEWVGLIEDNGKVPAGRRKMAPDVDDRFGLLHERIVKKTMRGMAKGWIDSQDALLDETSNGLISHVWELVDPQDRPALRDSLRSEIQVRIDEGGVESVIEDDQEPEEALRVEAEGSSGQFAVDQVQVEDPFEEEGDPELEMGP